ncbi:WYL domain-containing protein [Actinoplanes bogorensis]|uniref:WYL domain-containing protein n=1 Tax=Paractinoplanes bogorensis TaxID=1610840 RepID=A0ABS5YQJ0_9ACTN|nr:WYL domain-containing protein [Actinoplanes bogorensis]MBU2665714.1 WYL domain-containing protein [Actinoplanes bogorensis]
MNRTDRLYALVEELRRVAPRTRTAAWLAQRFEVSPRTIERDLDALRQGGVPIWATEGRSGGYGLDRDRTLPPLALTAGEAMAVTVGLRALAGSPFATAAATAARKVLAGLPADVRDAEEALAGRLHTVKDDQGLSPYADQVVTAVAGRLVLRLAYVDAHGVASEREVEPLSLLQGPHGWYLVGWCRLRRAVRGFQLDRLRDVTPTGETAAPREVDLTSELDRIAARPLLDLE